MFEHVDLGKRLDQKEYDRVLPDLKDRLGELQRRARDAGMPVMVVFEGWDMVSMSDIVNRFILPLDPRGFLVHPITAPSSCTPRGIECIMKNLKLNPLKKLEIILEGEHQEFATDLLDRAGVKGYTIIHHVSGRGSHGFHEGHLMFNEDDVLIMIIAAVPEELVEPILEAFVPFYNKHSGVVFISDIQVTRLVKFRG